MSKIGTENVKEFPTCIPLTGTVLASSHEETRPIDRKGIELQELL